MVINNRILATGNVQGVGVEVYWNNACTDKVTSINWSTLEPGQSVNSTIYIKNTGSAAVVLTLITENWDPTSAANYLDVGWNCPGYVLSSGSVVQATITLSVSASISEIINFSFDLVILGTEST